MLACFLVTSTLWLKALRNAPFLRARLGRLVCASIMFCRRLCPLSQHAKRARAGSMMRACRPLPMPRLMGAVRSLAVKVAEKEPEYHTGGNMEGYHTFHRQAPYKLRNGSELPELKVAYETWGHLNAKKDNAILLQCGMSASSHACSHSRNPAPGWWEEYIGPGRTLDTNLFFVAC